MSTNITAPLRRRLSTLFINSSTERSPLPAVPQHSMSDQDVSSDQSSDEDSPSVERKSDSSQFTLSTQSSSKLRPRTKIVCTLGPASHSISVIKRLLRAGMNVARLNFSHGSHEYHAETIANVRAAARDLGVICAIMLDSKGPEIRTGKLANDDGVTLVSGSSVKILCAADADFRGDANTISCDYARLPQVVKPGSVVKIDDGLLVLRVTDVESKEASVTCEVVHGGPLGDNKGINLPDTHVDLPALSDRDRNDLRFGVKQRVDLVAMSFTRSARDVETVKECLGEDGEYIKVICKIENQEGLDNFQGILEACDGIMVARGDLGVEIPLQQVTMAQKIMIRKCNIAGKPVITATQMLESMVKHPGPTRAECTDVANAVFDGTDCVMLSGETAKGKYPVEAVQVMRDICLTAEKAIDPLAAFQSVVGVSKEVSRAEAITSAAVKASLDLGSKLIIVLTESGASARLLSKYNPGSLVLAVTANEVAARQMMVSKCLLPMVTTRSTEDRMCLTAMKYGMQESVGGLQVGDMVVFVCGMVQGKCGSTDTLKIHLVPDYLA